MARGREPLFTVDGIGRVTSWSAAAARTFGRSEQAVLGRAADELMRTSDAETAEYASGLLAVPLDDEHGWAMYSAPRDPHTLDAAIEDALVRALLSESQLSLLVLDTELRVVRVSMATQVLHRPGADVVGKRVDLAYPLENPRREAAVIRKVLRTGEPVYSRLVTTMAAGGRAGRRYFSASAFRLSRPGGEAIGVAVTLLDVTRRERDRARGEAVSQVRQGVGRSLSLVKTCEDLADTLSPGFADIVLVALTEQVTAGDNPPTEPVDTATLLLRSVALRVGGESAAVWNIGDIGDIDSVERESSFVEAIAEGRPVLRGSRRAGHLLDISSHERVLREAGAHSMVVTPLTVRGRLLGLAVLARCGASAHFLRADLRAVEDIGLHTALCLENARRAAVARAIASTVQRRFLPERPRSQLGVDAAFVALSPPSRKGAWFDVIPLSGARCALVTGEMGSGGMVSLAAMGQLRTTLRALADLELQPDEALARLGDTVARLSTDPGSPTDGAVLSVACTYGVHDPATGTFTVACAGQPAPRVIDPDGRVVHLREATGPRLGTADPEPFTMAAATVDDGATLLLASREFDEVLGPDEGLRQLILTSTSAHDLANALFVKLAPQEGRSGTAMLVRTSRLDVDRTVAWELPARDQAVAEARRLTREWLGEQPAAVVVDGVESTELLVSELVTNAVRYGAPPIILRLTLDGALTVEVRDRATAAPNLRHPRVTDEGGRGLLIVSQLSEKWGTRRTEDGKAIWAEQPLVPTAVTDV